MSVYTQLESKDFEHILSQYALGSLVKFEGIAAGIENTNYKITLKKANIEIQYFLTIFEEINPSELDFFIPLLSHLKHNGCKLPQPMANCHGEFLFAVTAHSSSYKSGKAKNATVKSGAIFECLSGGHIENIQTHHCELIGQELARIHLAARSYEQHHENTRGFYWLQKRITDKQLHLSTADQTLLSEQFNKLKRLWPSWNKNTNLKKGFIHADLFPDNSLFSDDKTISGIIDFYAGGDDFWVYDVATTIMAWCQSKDFKLDKTLMAAMVKGYEAVRPLHQDELAALPEFIKLATLRFWVSRLIAKEGASGAALTTFKDPDEMKALLASM